MAYHENDIHGAFNQVLGRQANSAELDYFKKYLENGSIQPYEITQILGGHPEALQNRFTKQQAQFSNLLGSQDQNILNLASQNALGAYAALGRPDSSGLGSQIISAGQQLAAGRANTLADFYARQTNELNNAYTGFGNQAQNRAYGLTDEARQRNYQIEDYYRQQNDYNNYLRGQGARNLQSNLINAGLSLPGQIGGALLGGWSGGKALNGLVGGRAQTALQTFYGSGRAQGGSGTLPNQYGLSPYTQRY